MGAGPREEPSAHDNHQPGGGIFRGGKRKVAERNGHLVLPLRRCSVPAPTATTGTCSARMCCQPLPAAEAFSPACEERETSDFIAGGGRPALVRVTLTGSASQSPPPGRAHCDCRLYSRRPAHLALIQVIA